MFVKICGLVVLLTTLQGVQAQYQWSCSSLDTANNRYLLPDLGIRNDGDVADIADRLAASFTEVYIFPLPSSLSCNDGTVSAVQYCYFGSNFGTEQSIFTLLILQQSGSTYTITNTVLVRSTPSDQICTRVLLIFNYCCDIITLDMADQFDLPASNFAFGTIASRENLFLAYNLNNDANSNLLVNHYRFDQENFDATEGSTFTVDDDDLMNDRSVRLLQFFITPNPPTTTEQQVQTTTTSATTSTPTERATTVPIATTILATTNQPTNAPTDVFMNTTGPPIAPQTDATMSNGNTDTTGEEVFTVGTGPDSTGGNNNVGIIIGVVLGLAVALLVVIIVCVVIVIARRRSFLKLDQPDSRTGTGGGVVAVSFNNGMYVAGGGSQEYDTIKYDYAGVGPHVYSDIESKPSEYEQPTATLPYAHSGAKDDRAYEVLEDVSKQKKTSTWTSESIYMVPGSDEDTLYAQLDEIQTNKISRSAVGLGNLLGSGQFGLVYRGILRSSSGENVDVAVKTLKEGAEEQDKVKFLQEAAIMGQFKHPNVVTMYGVVTEGEPVLLILELLSKGDLRNHLLHMRPSEQGGDATVDGHTLLSYCRQVASGMTYLSSKAFVHRDLAARNILVSDKEICKIADFGMSRDLMDENYYVSHGGKVPVKWTAPEALHYKKYSTASDVWSYGALMYEIWSVGHKPYDSLTNTQVLQLVDTGFRLSPPPGCPRALYSIMLSCWHPMTIKRPTFADVSTNLSLPDTELLKWSEEDKSTHPGADKLGADLLLAQDLYRDLQVLYK